MPAPDSNATAAILLDLAEARRGLTTRRLGVQFHYFIETDSTNVQARRLGEAGAREGEVVVAEAQSRGRGRLGRVWQSPPFANLYLSILLRPNLAPVNAPQITLMAAVALAETVEFFSGRAVAIKWPNDIFFEGKKLAGILTEAACDSERVEYVILGIGLNVNYSVHAMPAELRPRATSLAQLNGHPVARENVLRRLIQDLDRCYGDLETSGFEALRSRWEARFIWRGRRVKVELGDQVLIGLAQGIEPSGALILEGDDGQRRSILAGDVIPLEI